MVDSDYLVQPGKKFVLADVDPGQTGKFKRKADAADAVQKNLQRMRELQDVFYASGQYALLVVFQAMDAGGKDGAIKHVFSGVNPQGCSVTSFKAPTPLELAHDFLWRVHDATPPKSMIGIFNRSHYESVLVERVKKLVPRDVWEKRYNHINQFEKLLADEGTRIVKFFLHISKDEQKARLEKRLVDKKRLWKFDPNDLVARQQWADYMDAYEDALGKCSTRHAPWYVVPADHKWFRNWVVSDVIVRTMEEMDLKYPKPKADLAKVKVK
jgi:PPK2 family polyphosphate:nucleotide phosphotransferase